MTLSNFVYETVELKNQNKSLSAIRSGFRSYIKKDSNDKLAKHLAGQIPYFYRSPDKIADDFKGRHDALESIYDLVAKLPDSPKFRNSHCGEILCAIYLTDILGFKMLYSKLTLLTAENTNIHKMDAMFVDTSSNDYKYFFVEAKCSILPTTKTKTKTHKSGILKQMISSLDNYKESDKRFDFTTIRDNLDKETFTTEEAKKIKKELFPPGPNLSYIGMAAINEITVNQNDDNYILSESCAKDFTFRAVVVSDLGSLAHNAYSAWDFIKEKTNN